MCRIIRKQSSLFVSLIAFLEKKRVKLHLIRAEYWMRTKDTSMLNQTQKKNRSAALRLLHNYWKSESFPINMTHREKIPQIRDQKGTMCAVAHILHHSGQQMHVNNLAQSNNHVLIDDVPDDHELADLLARNGVSKKEASKIQPGYLCQAPFGDPIAELFGAMLSIIGPAMAVSFWGLNRKLHNFGKNTIRTTVSLGIVMTLGGFGILYLNSVVIPVRMC